eukprot:5973429-Prymnesium_polylepis.2
MSLNRHPRLTALPSCHFPPIITIRCTLRATRSTPLVPSSSLTDWSNSSRTVKRPTATIVTLPSGADVSAVRYTSTPCGASSLSRMGGENLSTRSLA